MTEVDIKVDLALSLAAAHIYYTMRFFFMLAIYFIAYCRRTSAVSLQTLGLVLLLLICYLRQVLSALSPTAATGQALLSKVILSSDCCSTVLSWSSIPVSLPQKVHHFRIGVLFSAQQTFQGSTRIGLVCGRLPGFPTTSAKVSLKCVPEVSRR